MSGGCCPSGVAGGVSPPATPSIDRRILYWGNNAGNVPVVQAWLAPGLEIQRTGFRQEILVLASGVIRSFGVVQNSPGAGATITYSIWLNGVASPTTLVISSAAVSGIAVLAAPLIISAGDRISAGVVGTVAIGQNFPELTTEVETP